MAQACSKILPSTFRTVIFSYVSRHDGIYWPLASVKTRKKSYMDYDAIFIKIPRIFFKNILKENEQKSRARFSLNFFEILIILLPKSYHRRYFTNFGGSEIFFILECICELFNCFMTHCVFNSEPSN